MACAHTHTHTHTLEYYSAIKKEWKNAIYSNMNGPRDYHTRWSKSDKERQIPDDMNYIWNIKYYMNELTLKQKQIHTHRK